jgi:hypothetical protein
LILNDSHSQLANSKLFLIFKGIIGYSYGIIHFPYYSLSREPYFHQNFNMHILSFGIVVQQDLTLQHCHAAFKLQYCQEVIKFIICFVMYFELLCWKFNLWCKTKFYLLSKVVLCNLSTGKLYLYMDIFVVFIYHKIIALTYLMDII